MSEPQSSPPTVPPGPGDAWGVFGYLIAGAGVYGGLGWLLDRWLGTAAFLPIGLVAGVGLALYLTFVHYGHRS